MKIAVFGATGGSGQNAVRLALEAGHSVIAIVRNTSKVETKHENLQVVEGNIFSDETLVPHLAGVDAVLSCLGGTTLWKPTLYSESIRPIVSAMRQAEVKRLVCITSWCTTTIRGDRGPFIMEWFYKPFILRYLLVDMRKMEQFLMSEECHDINFTIVRPPELLKSPSKGQEILAEIRQFVKGGRMKIPREDVAKFMLSTLSTDKYDRAGVAIDVL
ncbi:flavin reductase (NADPH)-like [Glandiceps talaboti]